MRVSLSWLREFLQIPVSAEVLAEKLSMTGFEVEEILDMSEKVDGVIVGYVEELTNHPDAEKLSICKVNIGSSKILQIVCGADNIISNIHVALATEGVYLPAVDLKIKTTKLRGISSQGMICSMTELGLEDSSKGILVLEDLCNDIPKPGSSIASLLNLEDTLLDIAITANRPDAMSIVGIAREVSATLDTDLELPKLVDKFNFMEFRPSKSISEFIEKNGVFSLSLIRNINNIDNNINSESIKKKLNNLGMNSVNSIVDITNYVMIEQGQPLHAYDADKLENLCGKEISVEDFSIRFSRNLEEFNTIEGKSIKLNNNIVVITCCDIPISIAGVIGSINSSVDINTTKVWLEAGNFSPNLIRNSSKTVGIKTESSIRFEKGIPGNVPFNSIRRALDLFSQLSKNSDLKTYFSGTLTTGREKIILRPDRVRNILGGLNINSKEFNSSLLNSISTKSNENLSDKLIISALAKINCTVDIDKDKWIVSIPEYRNKDLIREIDLIEEVSRLIGYDCFNSNLPKPISPGGLNPIQLVERDINKYMTSVGFQEVNTMSLVSNQNSDKSKVPLNNPLMKEASFLRNCLLEEHINIVERNMKIGRPDIWIYEIGHIYKYNKNQEIINNNIISGVISGSKNLEKWTIKENKIDLNYYQARGLLQEVFIRLKLSVEDRPLVDDENYHPGRSAVIILEGKNIGKFGQIHPSKLKEINIIKNTYIFELDLLKILQASTRPSKWIPNFKKYSSFPSMERDVSFYIEKSINSNNIHSLILKNGKKLLESVELIDRFECKENSDKLSLTYRLTYRKFSATLTEEEIKPVHQQIINKLQSEIKAQIRM